MKKHVLRFVLAVILIVFQPLTKEGKTTAQVARVDPCGYGITLIVAGQEMNSCAGAQSIQFGINPPGTSAGQFRTADESSAGVSQLIVTKDVDNLSSYLEWASVSGDTFESARIKIEGPGFGAGPSSHSIEYQLSGVRVGSYQNEIRHNQAGERISFSYDSITVVYASELGDGSKERTSFASRSSSFIPSEKQERPVLLNSTSQTGGLGVSRFDKIEGGLQFSSALRVSEANPYNGWSPVSSIQFSHKSPTALTSRVFTEIVISKPVDLASTALMTAALKGNNFSSIQVTVYPGSTEELMIRNWIHEITLSGAVITSYTINGSDLVTWRKSGYSNEFSGLQETISLRVASQSLRTWTANKDGSMTESFGWQSPGK